MTRTDFPFADTQAARMLAAGIQQKALRSGQSLRKMGRALGYSQPVVLSHMASGRVPIPIERAAVLAEALDLNPRHFLSAVVAQRHPTVDWSLLTSVDEPADRMNLTSELTAGRTVEELTLGQRKVMREVAADPRAEERWLSPHEVEAMRTLRTARPTIRDHGLSRAELAQLRSSFACREGQT